MPHLGIDIGGSSAKVSVLGADLSVVSQRIHELPDLAADPETNRAARVELLALAVEEAGVSNDDGSTVTVATPGVVDAQHRRVTSLPGKLAGLEGVDWTAALHDRLRSTTLSVMVVNDGHAAVLGEARLGAGRGAQDLAMLTLGTGVGGGVMIGGRLLEGAHRRAGHLGHLSLDPYGEPSVFPTPGSLEWHVGDAYVDRRTNGRYRSNQALVVGVRRGEPEAEEAWRRLVRALAVGIASIVNVFDCERVILGGGLSTVGDLLFGPLAGELDEVEWRPDGQAVPVVPAALGRHSGSIGAAVFGRERRSA
jgi:glucokinase